MAGAVVMVIVLLVVIPVGLLMAGAVGAAIVGGALKRGVDADNRSAEGNNEYLELANRESEINYG